MGTRDLPDNLRVLAVYLGQPTHIGEVRGKPVLSSLVTEPAEASELTLSDTLAGNVKSKAVKPDGAVYAYPSEHYGAWEADGLDLRSGRVGENVATAGLTEEAVCIGDIWSWGDARLEVSKPRSGCWKLVLYSGRKDIVDRMATTGRSGWYFRVLEPGTVPTTGTMQLLSRPDGAPTVAEANAAMSALDADPALVERVLASPALATSWRDKILARRERSASL